MPEPRATRVHGGPPSSPLQEAVVRVGDRWTLLIVEALLDGPLRFADLVERIGIASNILSQRLKRLEQDALIVAQPYSERPPRFEYELTETGRELAGALRLLADWGAHHSEGSEPLQHAACGTQLEARWYCPTCARTVDDEEASDVHFV
jgi:DNA-binding HxlR family transcriptional regulator